MAAVCGCKEYLTATDTQPVIQLILVGQTQQVPTVCFTMTRERFRPFFKISKVRCAAHHAEIFWMGIREQTRTQRVNFFKSSYARFLEEDSF